MEKHVARPIYGLGIFVFFLYFIKVSSVSNASGVAVKQNIIDVMKTDKELCKVPEFLYQNNVTEFCYNVTYPEENIEHVTFKNTFLCLVFYDTVYKICQTNQLQKSFNNMTTFYSYIKRFSPGVKGGDQTKFCKNIEGITFSYKKLKPLLSSEHVDSPLLCGLTCFDMTRKFIPLCAMLPWSKSIDNDMKNNQQKEMSANSRQDNQDEKLEKIKTLSDKISSDVVAGNINVNANNANIINDETQGNKPVTIKDSVNVPVKQQISSVNSSITNSVSTGDKQSTINNINSSSFNKAKQIGISAEEVQEKPSMNDKKPGDPVKESIDASGIKVPEKSSVNDEKLVDSEKENVEASGVTGQERPSKIDMNSENPKKLQNKDTDATNNDAEVNKSNANEDVRTTTLSENTQDHENPANDDWSQLPNDPYEEPNQSIVRADQGQSIPEPPGQRDIIPHYHSIRTDEESHFFTYFTVVSLISIAVYIGYHNKQKILAIVLEGRRSRNSRGRRRPSTANYRKLDCTLEEAVTSQCNANVTHVIY